MGTHSEAVGQIYIGGLPLAEQLVTHVPPYAVVNLTELNRFAATNGLANPGVAVRLANPKPAAVKAAEQYYALADGELLVYPLHQDILLHGVIQHPKPALFRGLLNLAMQADEVVPKAELARCMHSDQTGECTTSTLKTYMKRIRGTLGDLGHVETGVIRAVRGVGYRALSSIR